MVFCILMHNNTVGGIMVRIISQIPGIILGDHDSITQSHSEQKEKDEQSSSRDQQKKETSSPTLQVQPLGKRRLLNTHRRKKKSDESTAETDDKEINENPQK